MILRYLNSPFPLSFAKHSGYSRSPRAVCLRSRSRAPPRANIRARSPFLGFRSAENIAFTSPLVAAAAVRACPARWFSFSRISRIPTASPYVSFRIIRASRALLSSASAPTRVHLASPSSVLLPQFPTRYPRHASPVINGGVPCPPPSPSSPFPPSLLLLFFIIIILLRPSLSPLWHPCARAHTHTACVWLSCDLAIRDTTVRDEREEADYSCRSSCSRGAATLSRRKDSSTFPTAPGPFRVSLV